MRIEQRFKEKNRDITIDVAIKTKSGKILQVDRKKFKPLDVIEGNNFVIHKRKTPSHEIIRNKLGDNLIIRFNGNINGYIIEFEIWEKLFIIT